MATKTDPKADPKDKPDPDPDDDDKGDDADKGKLSDEERESIVSEVVAEVRKIVDRISGKAKPDDDDDKGDTDDKPKKPATAREEEESMAELVKRLIGEHDQELDHDEKHKIIERVLEQAPESTTKFQRWFWG